MSTSGDVQYIGGYHEYIGGYHKASLLCPENSWVRNHLIGDTKRIH